MLSLERKFNKEATVSYIKAEEILPEELIRRIQEYADGVYIYIPRKPGTRHNWGQETGYKAELSTRNARIRSEYTAGASVKLFFSSVIHICPVCFLNSIDLLLYLVLRAQSAFHS